MSSSNAPWITVDHWNDISAQFTDKEMEELELCNKNTVIII